MQERDVVPLADSMPLPLSEVDQLEVRLQGKLRGRVRDFQIQTHDSGLILRGFARTYHAKQLAQHAVMIETNLPIFVNDIQVN